MSTPCHQCVEEVKWFRCGQRRVPRIRVKHEGPLLAVVVEDHDGATLVQVRGEIDLSNARELEATFGSIVAGLRSAPRVVVIDLSGVTFFSAPGSAPWSGSARGLPVT